MNLPQFVFTKMHGLGNDFVVVDLRQKQNARLRAVLESPAIGQACALICDRRLGIGADQLLLLRDAPAQAGEGAADLRMDIRNADGSEAEMCGNAIRAVACLTSAQVIATVAGLRRIQQLPDSAGGVSWRVEMGAPAFSGGVEEIEVLGERLQYWAVSMGNPHAVILLGDTSEARDLARRLEDPAYFARLGHALEMHPRFAPARTNVEFVQKSSINGESVLRVRIWERGAGATLACGTGACASVVAAQLADWVKPGVVRVALPGGELQMDWSGAGESVFMTGPAVAVYTGQWS